ncbi:MAG: response regulator [Verrucomicrobiota bacterium]|nr:response regulator [Verrucomicrobiota bacterium]
MNPPFCDIIQAVESAMSGKPKILVVEDETPVSMMMMFLLTRAGYETEVASTGKEALQKTEENDFDLLTLDVDLPDISGFEVCRRLKNNPVWRDTPVVFVSGRLHEQDRKRGIALGAADHITKPFDADDFVARIRPHVKTGGEVNLLEITRKDSH